MKQFTPERTRVGNLRVVFNTGTAQGPENGELELSVFSTEKYAKGFLSVAFINRDSVKNAILKDAWAKLVADTGWQRGQIARVEYKLGDIRALLREIGEAIPVI